MDHKVTPHTLQPVEIGFGNEKYTFSMRMISVAEETEVINQFLDLEENADFPRRFEICRDALDRFKVEPVTVTTLNGKKSQPKEIDFAKAFAEYNPTTERIV